MGNSAADDTDESLHVLIPRVHGLVGVLCGWDWEAASTFAAVTGQLSIATDSRQARSSKLVLSPTKPSDPDRTSFAAPRSHAGTFQAESSGRRRRGTQRS